MEKITIGVDLDSTLNNLHHVWIDKYNHIYGDNLNPEDITSWNIHEFVKPECGEKIYDILKEPGMYYNLGVKDEHTLTGFTFLYHNFDVYIVSACDPFTIRDKAEWIKEYFPFFDIEKRFIACYAKHLINVDYLIDDGPHNIIDFPNKTVIMDAPYNQDVSEEFVDHRVHNWLDIVKLFEPMVTKTPEFVWGDSK